jgi:putative membrane protein insertion efficiency factor
MKQLLIGLVRLYRLLLSPWVGGQCRFYPTCSAYTIEALDTHGAAAGTYLGAVRILRCQPWCEGGHDPVPSQFTWAPWRHRASETDHFELCESGSDDARSSPPMHNSASSPEDAVLRGATEPGASAPKSSVSLSSSKP